MSDTKPLTPVPDDIAGDNVPYRGIVDHGVPTGNIESTDEAHYHLGRPVEYEDDPKPVDPVPVRIVGQGSREIKKFGVGRFTLDGNTQQVAARDDKRTALKIANLSATETIFIGPGNAIAAYAGGYPVGPGKDISLSTTEPVYAVGNAVTPADISVLSERTEAFQ